MGNFFGISNPLGCKVDVNQEVRFCLCPARLSEELRSEMEILRRSREGVEKRTQELYGRPGEVVRDEVRGWIAAVDTLDRHVSELLRSLNHRRPCFRFLCCSCYSPNYALGLQVWDKLAESRNLKAERDGWAQILVWSVQSFLTAEEEMGDELKNLEALKNDLGMLAEEEILKAGGRKQKSSQLTKWSRNVDELLPRVERFLNQPKGQHSNEERSRMISKLRMEIRNLCERGEMIRSKGDLVIMALPDKIPNLSVPDFLVGIEDGISTIFGFLKDDRTSVIGIHGMGGAGKTTLVKEIVRRLNLPRPEVEFDFVAFAVVSQTQNILKIQAEIGARLGYSWSSNTAANATDTNQGYGIDPRVVYVETPRVAAAAGAGPSVPTFEVGKAPEV